MWTCPKCNTTLGHMYSVCWKCGTAPDGTPDPDFVPPPFADPERNPLPEEDESLAEKEGARISLLSLRSFQQADWSVQWIHRAYFAIVVFVWIPAIGALLQGEWLMAITLMMSSFFIGFFALVFGIPALCIIYSLYDVLAAFLGKKKPDSDPLSKRFQKFHNDSKADSPARTEFPLEGMYDEGIQAGTDETNQETQENIQEDHAKGT